MRLSLTKWRTFLSGSVVVLSIHNKRLQKVQDRLSCRPCYTCTTHSGVKKTHDWVVDQIVDLFRRTHKVKTQEVVRNRGQRCGDIDLTPPLPSLLFLLLLTRPGGYTVNLFSFYFYKLIGKLTSSLQLQEFSQSNPPVVITLNIDVSPMTPRSHTHPSHIFILFSFVFI